MALLHDSADRPDSELDEIEVTPEMIEAGVTELVRFNPDYEAEADAVARIFRAMTVSAPNSQKGRISASRMIERSTAPARA